MAVEHPAEVNAVVNPVREANDFRIAGEALLYSENTAEQQRRVDRGDLAVPAPVACFCVEPVVEPAALMKGSRIEKAQRDASAFDRLAAWNPIPISGDAESG